MALASDVKSLSQDGADPHRLHPHLLALVKWCASLVWGAAAEVMRRLLDLQANVPALLPLPPASVGAAQVLPSHISHAATVHCEVLRDPIDGANVDVIFVHGLYGSLANTWRQGEWRKKHKTELNKVPLKRHATKETPCTCNHKHTTINDFDSDKCTCRDGMDYIINKHETNENKKHIDNVGNTSDNINYRHNNEKRSFTNTDKEYKEKYILSNMDIVENYEDIMGDIFTNDEFSVYGGKCDIDMILSSINENRTKSNKTCEMLNCDVSNKDNFADEDKLYKRCDILAINDPNRIDLESINENSNDVKQIKTIQECHCLNENDAISNTKNGEYENGKITFFKKICEVGCGCICPQCYSDCWPRDWLGVDYPDARIISVSYTSDPHLWRPVWIKPHKRLRLHERARQMTEQLLELGVGSRPIVWVGHSKGGLFIKQIYAEGYEAFSECGAGVEPTAADVGRLWRHSAGFMFYSVPHRGSPLADFNIPPIVARSIELLEMGKDCEEVLALQSRWLRAARGALAPPVVRSLVETRRTLMALLWLRIVSVESADAGIGALGGVSVDHRDICKPSGRRCPLYRELLHVLDTALRQRVRPLHTEMRHCAA